MFAHFIACCSSSSPSSFNSSPIYISSSFSPAFMVPFSVGRYSLLSWSLVPEQALPRHTFPSFPFNSKPSGYIYIVLTIHLLLYPFCLCLFLLNCFCFCFLFCLFVDWFLLVWQRRGVWVFNCQPLVWLEGKDK